MCFRNIMAVLWRILIPDELPPTMAWTKTLKTTLWINAPQAIQSSKLYLWYIIILDSSILFISQFYVRSGINRYCEEHFLTSLYFFFLSRTDWSQFSFYQVNPCNPDFFKWSVSYPHLQVREPLWWYGRHTYTSYCTQFVAMSATMVHWKRL